MVCLIAGIAQLGLERPNAGHSQRDKRHTGCAAGCNGDEAPERHMDVPVINIELRE